MGMFSNLMSKIFGHTPSAPVAQNSTPAPVLVAGSPAAPSPASSVSPQPVATSTPVDVEAILNGLAAKNPEHLDWKKSIVDLLKLVGMDSSLSARKELATELQYSGDQSDSATMNMWLHKEVLKKLAANGGKVPSELLD